MRFIETGSKTDRINNFFNYLKLFEVKWLSNFCLNNNICVAP